MMDHSTMSDYMAHGYCFSWEPGLVWLHVGSDLITGLAYYVITAAMVFFAVKRRDLPFRSVFLLFSLFILACGTTHFFAAYTVYRPDYWPEGWVKAITALISVASAFVLIPQIPKAIVMPGLEKALDEVQRLNAEQKSAKMRLQSLVNVLQHDADSIQELLDFALNEAITMTASRYGYIYYYSEEKKQFTLNSWSHGVMESCSVANPQTLYDLEKTGIWGEAVRQRKTIVINDFAAPDPLKKGYPEGHVPLTRFLTIPLFDQHKIVAVIGMANKEDAYDASDEMQLSLLMNAVWEAAERKRVEIKLRDTTEYLENLFNHANAPIIVWDPQFAITRFNQAFEKLTGRVAADVIGQPLEILFSSEKISEYMDLIHKTVTGERWETVEIEIRHVNGSIATVLWNSATLFDESGTNPIATIAQGQEITLRKHAENELKQKNSELERFIYTVSHDLKSPLVTISAFLGYLEMDLKTDNQTRIDADIGYIRTAADKMALMLAELLELSRVGRVPTAPVEVLFSEIVSEALQLVAGGITKKGVQISVQNEHHLLYGDHSRLREIWQNLIENAVKYMGEQTMPHIELGFKTTSTGTVYFVSDNGMGIAENHRDTIFGLFNKLDMNSEGSGLGLALVKRIIETYGGRIWVESAGAGAGSSFRFTLPQATYVGDSRGVSNV